jgi:hypothetical protein
MRAITCRFLMEVPGRTHPFHHAPDCTLMHSGGHDVDSLEGQRVRFVRAYACKI